ncbi:MAG: ABC transporter ATP-binding protein [Plesiomonas sp.]|uniref:ABC transporter ATP-binding protein n=1 Tax=Plesiomonas sp. TaxID=2486279 RepID=UPI003F2A78BA
MPFAVNVPVLAIDDVLIKHNDTVLIAPFSAQVMQGQRVSLTGESGCGKTTLLIQLCGMFPTQSGSISLFGNPISPETQASIRQKIAYLPQQIPAIEMSVEHYLQRILQFSHNQHLNTPTMQPIMQQRTVSLLEEIGLNADILTQRMSDLSGGQRQRVGIVACLQLDRPLLLADEPTSALDSESKHKFFALLEKQACSLLAVTHDPDLMQFCHRHWLITNQQFHEQPLQHQLPQERV